MKNINLTINGYNVTVHALGLTSGSASKIDAFTQAGIPFFENWEALISAIKL